MLIQIAYALALAPVSYFGVRAVSLHYQQELGDSGAKVMRCLQGLLIFTPFLAALCPWSNLYSASVIPITLLIPLWAGHELYVDYLAFRERRKKLRLFVKGLESFIEHDFESLDKDGDDSLSEQDIVNASISFSQQEPDKAAALEQLLVDIAEVGHIVGVIEQETFSGDTLIGSVRRNIYAVRKSDLRKYPATLRSKYQVW